MKWEPQTDFWASRIATCEGSNCKVYFSPTLQDTSKLDYVFANYPLYPSLRSHYSTGKAHSDCYNHTVFRWHLHSMGHIACSMSLCTYSYLWRSVRVCRFMTAISVMAVADWSQLVYLSRFPQLADWMESDCMSDGKAPECRKMFFPLCIWVQLAVSLCRSLGIYTSKTSLILIS